jgi:1-acyl-sn-glycerol-3-phosphate acyltransferase
VVEASTRRQELGRGLSRGWRILRTALGFVSLGVACLVLSLVVLPLLCLRAGRRDVAEVRAQKAIRNAIRGWLGALERLGIVRVHCSGAERLGEPGTLVVANHPTLLDALVLMAYMPQADCVVKQRYYDNFFLGGPARAAGYIPSRGGPEVVEACVERLVRGRSLIIFPEGTRSPVGGLGPFQRGAAHIALRAGRDPLPVVVTCEPPTLYHGQAWWDVPERRFDLGLEVGEPLRVKQLVGADASPGRAARALTAALREHFEKRGIRAGA